MDVLGMSHDPVLLASTLLQNCWVSSIKMPRFYPWRFLNNRAAFT